MRRTAASWLFVFALACLGLAVPVSGVLAQDGGTTVQGTQSSDDAQASTGQADGTNENTFSGGPSATGADGSSASQIGSNSATVSQSGSAKSGDPVAGAQVTGAVADNVTVQNQNASQGASARSGSVDLINSAEVLLGPNATVTGSGRPQAAQTGSNAVAISQDSAAWTGDAVAGSQVTGIVGDGEHVVQNQNVASCGAFDNFVERGLTNGEFGVECALSGNASVTNTAGFRLGPFAGPADSSDPANVVDVAQAGQVGDNDAVVSQSTQSRSGDALFGSQVTGVVGGSATVQNQNSSDNSRFGLVGQSTPLFPAARSGDATGVNGVGLTDEAGLLVGVSTLGSRAVSNGSTAQASQTGNNTADIAQDVRIGSGDALSGAQVTGGVGDQGGFFTVQNQQASEGDSSVSGDVTGVNVLLVEAGPSAFAGEVVVVDEEDLPAGGVVDEDMDDATAQASQNGDNDVTTETTVQITSGDALAGAQVTGAVGYTDVVAQEQNSADGASAISGSVNGLNLVSVGAGPHASAGGRIDVDFRDVNVDIETGSEETDCQPSDPECNIVVDPITLTVIANAGDLDAQASQVGDNFVSAAAGVKVGTGDAVAGGQVTGAVTGDGGSVTVQNQNRAEDVFASSGSVSRTGNLVFVRAGPLADTHADVDIDFGRVDIDLREHCTAAAGNACSITVGDITITADAFLDDGTAQASQTGDNSVDTGLGIEVSSGDAVGGGQVTGVVSGDAADVTTQNQNSAENATSISGSVSGIDNLAAIVAGPQASATADVDVDAGDIDIDIFFRCHGAAGADCVVDVGAITVDVAADAEDLTAQASQTGDNAVGVALGLDVGSGDAVGGGQVTGVVSGDGSQVVTQNQNAAENIASRSGSVNDVSNGATVQAGPLAETGVTGDIDIDDIDIDIDAECTIASGASQQGAATCRVLVDNITVFGDLTADDGQAQASQIGDNTIAVAAGIEVASGDAVSGAQVTGVVSGDGSEITTQNQNAAENVFATSGDVSNVDNVVDVQAGPQALAGADLDVDIDDITVDIDLGCHTAAEAECTVTVDDPIIVFGGSATADDLQAQASQTGNNAVDAAVAIEVGSGDAVAGSQVTGVVTGSRSDVIEQNQNAAEGAVATSGSVDDVANTTTIHAGPQALAEGDVDVDVGTARVTVDITCDGPGTENCPEEIDESFEATIIESFGDANAQASQIGDNDVSVDQSISVGSGDAVSGSQISGVVAGAGSDVTVQDSNASSGDETGNIANSGDVTGTVNRLDGGMGPISRASAFVDDDRDIEGSRAASSQTGTNDSDIGQDLDTESGDAVSGSQVFGIVRSDGAEPNITDMNGALEVAAAA